MANEWKRTIITLADGGARVLSAHVFVPATPDMLPRTFLYKYGLQINSTGISWELASNKVSQVPACNTELECSLLLRSPGYLYAHKFQIHRDRT